MLILQIYKREGKTVKRGKKKKKQKNWTKAAISLREIEETRCPFEAVAAREEVRMVVSGGSKHALTVLWMGRWFLDFRSSPPGDGYPLEEHLPRRENSCVVHAPQFIGNLRQNCIPPCAILLTKKEVRVSRLKKEIRISKRNYVERRDHVDRSDRWILHGGWQFLFLTLFLIHESLLDLCGGFSSFKIILRLITWWDWIWNLYNDLYG